VVLRGHEGVASVALSPDGRWVASSSYFLLPQDVVRVSDLRTGKVVWTLPGQARAEFSPDGRWLVTGGDECRVWEVGSWRLARVIPRAPGTGAVRHATFSPDGRALAVAAAPGVVRLVDPLSGRERATLAGPDTKEIQLLRFSRDGTHLAGVCSRAGVRVWDLRRIRESLAKLGLDWAHEGAPPGPEAGPARR
jgi:WD40 repeat protein